VRPGLLGRQTAACRAVGVCRMTIVTRDGAIDFEQSAFCHFRSRLHQVRGGVPAGAEDC